MGDPRRADGRARRRPRASAPARGADARVAGRGRGADRRGRRGPGSAAPLPGRPGDRRLPDRAGHSPLDDEGNGARLADLPRRRSVGDRRQRRARLAARPPARSSRNDRGMGRLPGRGDRHDADGRGLRRRRPPCRPHAIPAGGHGRRRGDPGRERLDGDDAACGGAGRLVSAGRLAVAGRNRRAGGPVRG